MAGVDIVGLSKRYEAAGREFLAVNDVTTQIPDGSFTVIVGKSGCGKTTLLRLIAGLEERNTGKITMNSTKAHRIGVVFQEHRLMPWLTVRENMAFSLVDRVLPSVADEKVSRYLKLLGLEDFQYAYPAQLSGGMAQRVAIGRTLCFDPDIILMDEPFGALDYFTRKRLQQEIVDLFLEQKKTIVFVTHDVAEAVYLGQRVIVMEEGEIIKEIPIDMLYYREPDSKEFLSVQSQILSILSGNKR